MKVLEGGLRIPKESEKIKVPFSSYILAAMQRNKHFLRYMASVKLLAGWHDCVWNVCTWENVLCLCKCFRCLNTAVTNGNKCSRMLCAGVLLSIYFYLSTAGLVVFSKTLNCGQLLSAQELRQYNYKLPPAVKWTRVKVNI